MMGFPFCLSGRLEFKEFLFVFTFVISVYCSKVGYKAAVCELTPMLNTHNRLVGRYDALGFIKNRIDEYEVQIKSAAAKGAELIVFPENGLCPPGLDRVHLIPYLENTPNVGWNPTEYPREETEILSNLSSLAKKHRIYLIVNVGTKESCTTLHDSSCPEDGQYQYSTNVAYSDDGTILAIYNKRNIFKDSPFNPARELLYMTFETRFGQFAMVTGNDLLLNDPTFVLLKRYKIRNLILPSEWHTVTPLFRSVIIYSIFARANSINLIVSSLHYDKKQSFGSGIFSPKGVINYHYDPDDTKHNLVVGDLEGTTEERHQYRPKLCFKPNIGIPSRKGFLRGVMNSLMFHFLVLTEREGSVSLCMSEFCCRLEYEMSELNETETYALGTANGYVQPDYLHESIQDRYYAQICSLTKCRYPDNCVAKIIRANTIFNRFTLTGCNFKARNIGTSLLTMNGTQYHFRDIEWIFNDTGQIFVETPMTLPLHSAIIFSRVYSNPTDEFRLDL